MYKIHKSNIFGQDIIPEFPKNSDIKINNDLKKNINQLNNDLKNKLNKFKFVFI